MLDRETTLQLMEDPARAAEVTGALLCFVMIGVEQRFGQWRYAGAARTLADAFERMQELLDRLSQGEWEYSLQEMAEADVLDYRTDLDGSMLQPELAARGLAIEGAVVLAEGGAPYDDHGFAILRVEQGHPYTERGVESGRPGAWDGGDLDEDLERDPAEWIEA